MTGVSEPWPRHGPDIPQPQQQEEEANCLMREQSSSSHEGLPETSSMKISFHSIIEENKRKAKESCLWQKNLGPTDNLPLYTQPTDTEVYHRNSKKNVLEKHLIEQFIQKKQQTQKDYREDHMDLLIGATDRMDHEGICRPNVNEEAISGPLCPGSPPYCYSHRKNFQESDYTEDTVTLSQIPAPSNDMDSVGPQPDLVEIQGIQLASISSERPSYTKKTIQSEPLDLTNKGQSQPDNAQAREDSFIATPQPTQVVEKSLAPRSVLQKHRVAESTASGSRGLGNEKCPGDKLLKITDICSTTASRKRHNSGTSQICEIQEDSLALCYGLQGIKDSRQHLNTYKVRAEYTDPLTRDEVLTGAEDSSQDLSPPLGHELVAKSQGCATKSEVMPSNEILLSECEDIEINDGTEILNDEQIRYNTNKMFDMHTSTRQLTGYESTYASQLETVNKPGASGVGKTNPMIPNLSLLGITDEGETVPETAPPVKEDSARSIDESNLPDVSTTASWPAPVKMPDATGGMTNHKIPDLHSFGVTDANGSLPKKARPVSKDVNEKLKASIGKKKKYAPAKKRRKRKKKEKE